MLYSNVLIIDDDPIFRLVLDDALQTLGAENIAIAEDGAQGLRHITNSDAQYDLIICDLQMPNLDGVSVVRELGNLKYSGAVIIASGEAGAVVSTVQRMALMLGVRILGTLSKPLNLETLASLTRHKRQSNWSALTNPMTRHALKAALSRKLVRPYYQPKYCIREHRVKSAEVLARFFAEDGKLLNLEAGLKAAEKYGLMQELTFALIDQVADDFQEWASNGIGLDLSINISPAMLCNLDLPDALADRFQSAGIDLNRITLEVTEERLLEYDPNVLEVLSRLRLLGMKLSIDDFGTGATSIDQLRLYPFNEMKIDRSFIQGALTDPFARITVDASIKLASMLNMTIVAEGVETKMELDFVRSAGVNMAQGFLIARPLSSKDLLAWLAQFNPNTLKVA